MRRGQIRQLVYSALCVALGVVLPIALHGVPNAGRVLLPMHIPVLICGLLCSWPYGLACGILTPLLSSLLTGMPPAAVLPGMLFELGTYGAVSALLGKFVRTENRFAGLYLRLIAAMLAGRAVYGVMNALVFSAGEYSLTAFLTASFVTALPGIVIQLALIPAAVRLLELPGKRGEPDTAA